jgi:AraC-like DNA-binding protein/mannose-6-phosphate isomerase-like protein (cupin superfamily)
MDIFKEPIIYQHQALSMKVWRFVQHELSTMTSVPWHYHKEVEFILVEEGRLEVETPAQSYSLAAGDVVILGSSQLHRTHKIIPEQLKYIVLHVHLQTYFDPATMMYYGHFSEVYEALDGMNYIFKHQDARQEMAEIITSIHDEVMCERKGYEMAVSMNIHHLMLSLLRHDTQDVLQPYGHLDAAVMQPIVSYVEERLADRIDMEDVCRLAGMSYTYFSKYFKRKMGVAFTDFVNRKRIAKAERMLVTEQQSIVDIAEQVGISNMAHFYELFKRYNQCTPKQYMERMLHTQGQ